MITFADICGSPNGCTVGDGDDWHRNPLAAIALAIAWYNVTVKKR